MAIAGDKYFASPELYSAASKYSLVHRLMWECWNLAGGYWRDIDGEVPKFRDASVRKEIADIIGRVKELDIQVL